VLGGFEVGDGAKIGSNAVVIKPVPAGATAVGIPARIIPSKSGASADVTEESRPKFSAYGVTQEDDPLSQAMRGLIDKTGSQEHQIALLWAAIEKLACEVHGGSDCVPDDAAKQERFEADKLNQLVGK
jgi:serine O-acetyltransferase